MSSIFISYTFADNEVFVKKLYVDLSKRGFQVWQDPKAMESRGQTFHQEIRDAIAEIAQLILVIGPKADSSDYVINEWKFSYKNCKVIIPIIRTGD